MTPNLARTPPVYRGRARLDIAKPPRIKPSETLMAHVGRIPPPHSPRVRRFRGFV